MRYQIVLLCFYLVTTNLAAAQSKGDLYNYTIDLTNVVDDRLFVELSVPTIKDNEITFFLPKMIPGTYAIEDYGRFVSNFKAFDRKGKLLPVEKSATNSWQIKEASKLSKISYWVEDTFDTAQGDPAIFEPAGTNIEANANFVLNNAGFFGYFDQLKDIPFVFNIIRDNDFYGSTGLIAEQVGIPINKLDKERPEDDNKKVDVYRTENYDQLVDSPIMYSRPDTVIIKVANTEVLISSYSPNNQITAKEIAASVREVLMSQKEFLGGQLPVDKYAFIFYWTDKPVRSYGALEHSYSSFYHIPEGPIGNIDSRLRDFAAHEFFHIVTPLTIHSEEIKPFDFNDPKMSKHLWLYEGVTEYFAGSVQVKYDLISRIEYLYELKKKIIGSEIYKDDLPFTEMSQFVLDKYADQYGNVYQKGALIGLCLDLKLLNLSTGKYGLQNLIADLSKTYGKDLSFRDDELVDQISSLTYPEIEYFLNRYVAGSEPLPLVEIFESVGVIYTPVQITYELTTGLESGAMRVVDLNDKKMYQIARPDALNAQGKVMNFEVGDIILKLNGEELPEIGPEIQGFFLRQRERIKNEDTITYTVLRLGQNDKRNEIKLSAPVVLIEKRKTHILEFNPASTAQQIFLREIWLSPSQQAGTK